VVLAAVQEGKPAACLSNLERTAVRHISDAWPLLLNAATGSGNRRLPGVNRAPRASRAAAEQNGNFAAL
jgi:hypothetical protein